jgi:hypothetical protein
MKWDVHICDPRTHEVRTEILDVPEAETRGGVRLVYREASKAFNANERDMLAVPHRKQSL